MTREICNRKTFAGNKMLTHLNHTEHSDEYQSQFCHFSCLLFIYLFDFVWCVKKKCSVQRCDVSGVTTESQLNQAYRFAGTLNNSRLFEHFLHFTIIAFICDGCVSNVQGTVLCMNGEEALLQCTEQNESERDGNACLTTHNKS